MDRIQYQDGPVDSYKPFDLAMRNKPAPAYALLADLQTIVPAKSSAPSNARQSPHINGSHQGHHSASLSPAYRSGSQSPAYHAGSPGPGFHVATAQPLYREVSPNTTVNGLSNQPVYCNTQGPGHPLTNGHSMYHHETVEEVRTEHTSSGPGPSTVKMSGNNNLSELDTLINDLNTARYAGVFKESNGPVVNGSRPNVQTLLDELSSVGHGEEVSHSVHQMKTSSDARGPSASNATKELDVLMASLSDFKINASTAQSQVETYAKPQKPKTPPPPKQPTPSPPKENLDCMLVDLTSHMTEQGITTTQKGCCCACSKPIVGQVITALGKTWHPEHFLCAHCNQELGTRNFFERDGKPYCETDYHNLFSPRCAYCDGPILDKCVTALDKAWHPEHFFCAQCGNTFGEDGFHEKDGKPYCKDDYFNMFAPKCGGCNSPIMENYISALNAQWHPECFVCRDCKGDMNSKQYYDVDGKPVCGPCLGVSDDEEDE